MRAFEVERWLSVVAMAAGLLALPQACSLVNAPSEVAGGTGGGGASQGCTTFKDCGEATECRNFACKSGACETEDVKAGTPCKGGSCDGNGNCVASSCKNMAVDGKETAVDCGGGECDPCADGLTCKAFGDCKSKVCSGGKCAPCKTEADCAPAGDLACIAGVCAAPKKNGDACGAAAECSSGVCVEGICCDTECPSGACGSCKLPGKEGTCTALAAASTPLAPNTCPAGATCDGKFNTCQACSKDTDCATGSCADGVCCNTKCSGGCERCDLAGSVGTCKTLPAGAVGKDCGPTLCGGSSPLCVTGCLGEKNCALGSNCIFGVCKVPQIVGACSSAAQCESFVCASGNCATPSCGNNVLDFAESDVDCGGNSCAKCAQGKRCLRNDDCASGFCADGVCCNAPCNGPCDACSAAEGAKINGLCSTLGGSCSDGWACTAPGTCSNGACTTPAPSSGAVVYLDEDFSDNSAGWQLGAEWQVGPVFESQPYQAPTPEQNAVLAGDPAYDHTITADNGVAGVVLGGFASSAAVHDFYWLTSPVLDTKKAPTLALEFWRWLTSDYVPFMSNRVEVFDGKVWVTLEELPQTNTFLLDRAWTYQKFDLTPYRNDKLQVRFGFKVGQTGAVSIGQWNLDDVRVATSPCGAGF